MRFGKGCDKVYGIRAGWSENESVCGDQRARDSTFPIPFSRNQVDIAIKRMIEDYAVRMSMPLNSIV